MARMLDASRSKLLKTSENNSQNTIIILNAKAWEHTRLQHVLPKNHDFYTNQDSSLHCCYKSNVNANVGRHAIPQNLPTLHTNKAESLVDTDKKNAAKFNQLRGCTQIVEHLLGWHCLHRHKNCVHCQL